MFARFARFLAWAFGASRDADAHPAFPLRVHA